ncbi:unnamed protein product [Urochloa decumbens]|uniref:non-specific serine/threonine protein kinase n=1 Tax=Urochloa decumbens TaxID=240449 RepID=A0ABC9AQA9_9POAL
MDTKLQQHTSVMPKEFTLRLLNQITDHFSSKRIIGHGGCGIVYKGVLDNGEEIAVKKLYRSQQPGLDNDKQFQNECTNLMRAQHKNIVRLVGYCYEIRHELVEHNGGHILAGVEEKILCFEYMQGRSLENHLSDESHGLDWRTRYNIIRGICEGLYYLHNGSNHPIYHLDLKPANILLDKEMMPKIGDFGTRGYMPPEYIERHKITKKFDIFSLGIIIIQIVAGPKGYTKSDEMPSQQFIELVHENWCKRFQATISVHTSQEIKTCIEIALRCVEADRVKRPTISEILDELNKFDTITVNELNKVNIANSSPIDQVTTDLKCKKAINQYGSSGMFSKSAGKDGSMLSCSSGASLASMPPGVKIDCGTLQLPNVKIFKFEDLRLATKNFRPDSVLGEGGHGSISKGWIDENRMLPCMSGTGMTVAVKKNIHEHDLPEEWLAKVHYLSQFAHPNLVKLIGYCKIDDFKLLVCQYMQRGSLENHLFQRMQDIIGQTYNAKLSSFGLNGPVGERGDMSTTATLTYVYAAPEDQLTAEYPCINTGPAPDSVIAFSELTAQSDIYGFGVVLLETLTGRHAFDSDQAQGEHNLDEWARSYLTHRHKIFRLVDNRLDGQYSTRGVRKVAALALQCLALDAEMRPSMDAMVSVLEGIQDSADQDRKLGKQEHLKSRYT